MLIDCSLVNNLYFIEKQLSTSKAPQFLLYLSSVSYLLATLCARLCLLNVDFLHLL